MIEMFTKTVSELQVGDRFSQAGSTRAYTVTEVVEAHRAEYVAVVRVTSSKSGVPATIAFPRNINVLVEA